MSTRDSLQVLDNVIVLGFVQTSAGADRNLRATLVLGYLNDLVLLDVSVYRHYLWHFIFFLLFMILA